MNKLPDGRYLLYTGRRYFFNREDSDVILWSDVRIRGWRTIKMNQNAVSNLDPENISLCIYISQMKNLRG